MKTKFIILNIFFAITLFCLIGGGYIYTYGYLFLIATLGVGLVLYPQESRHALFNRTTIWLWAFLIYVFISSSFSITTTASLFTRFSPVIMYMLYKSILSKSPQLIPITKKMIYVAIIILLFYCYKSFLFIQENPAGLRDLISSEKDESVVVGGGFALPYALCIFIPLIVDRIRLFFSNDKRLGIFLLLFVIIGSLLVIYSLYMTALIILLTGILWVYIKDMPLSKRIFAIIVSAVVIFSCYQFVLPALEYVSGDDTRVLVNRFEEIDSILQGNDVEDSEDFYSRIQLSISSIKTFFQHPLLGVGWKSNYDSFELEKLGVGQHAQWFDIFAIYGLFAILIITFIAKIDKDTYINKRNNITCLFFIITGFLNPIFLFTIIFVTYFLSPLINICWGVNPIRS